MHEVCRQRDDDDHAASKRYHGRRATTGAAAQRPEAEGGVRGQRGPADALVERFGWRGTEPFELFRILKFNPILLKYDRCKKHVNLVDLVKSFPTNIFCKIWRRYRTERAL